MGGRQMISEVNRITEREWGGRCNKHMWRRIYDMRDVQKRKENLPKMGQGGDTGRMKGDG